MSINTVVLLGRLGRDPEVKYFQSGNALCEFNLAIDRGPSADGTDQGPTWVPVKLWGAKQAEVAADFLKKGTLCAVSGKLEMESWTNKQGESRSRLVVIGYRFTSCSPRPDGAKPPMPEELPF